jgi:hypothetical protein
LILWLILIARKSYAETQVLVHNPLVLSKINGKEHETIIF